MTSLNDTVTGSDAFEALFGSTFQLNSYGELSNTTYTNSIKGCELVAVYFSAHWCPPCRTFTPILKAAFNEWSNSNNNKRIQVIFCSSDRSKSAMESYFKTHGNYLAVPFGDSRNKSLAAKCGVSGIPKLVVFNKTGQMIDANARQTLSQNRNKALNLWTDSQWVQQQQQSNSNSNSGQKQKSSEPKIAGKIGNSGIMNSLISSFSVLNLSSDESTISTEKFPSNLEISANLCLVSDADEEMLILIGFRSEVNLESLLIYALESADTEVEEMSKPKQMSIYKLANLNVDFNDIKSKKADLVIKKLNSKKMQNGQSINLKKNAKASIAFNKVNYLVLYISSNLGGTEQTYFNGLRFNGSSTEKTDMSKWEQASAEARKKLHQM